MTAPLPSNVYRLPQADFDAIPGSPWVYWIQPIVRKVFENLSSLKEVVPPKHGLSTCDNLRFLRFWWEIPTHDIDFGLANYSLARISEKKWFPYMKGGPFKKWYGNQEYLFNWTNGGSEIKSDIVRRFPYLKGNWGMVVTNSDFYFSEGITWSDLSTKKFGVRYLPPGFGFDVKGSSGFPKNELIFVSMAVMNSQWMNYILGLLNPTVSFQVGDIARVPFQLPTHNQKRVLENLVIASIYIQQSQAQSDEKTFDFISPLPWLIGLRSLTRLQAHLQQLETQMDNEVFVLYGISPADRAAIEAELAGGALGEAEEPAPDATVEDEEEAPAAGMSAQELAVRWVSYAVGIVLGRFQPGLLGALGSAVYRRSDFAVGSLPAPDEAEFDELVGSADTFAHIDPQGGRHVFPAAVEQALQALALPDGIAVLDADSPRDLPALVSQALELMLGESQAQAVIQAAANGDLRKFLEKDFFTAWHFKWYRKRPVYWPIQSSKRSYGFVLFHEKITRDTLYALQHEPYLDTRRNAVALKMADLRTALASASGTLRKKLEKELDELQKLADELTEFARDLEAITLGGYAPEADWIDDGVILRMAPLWKVIPVWKSEPKKYWERLEAGDFDWSHMAMKYWPERVKGKCKTNKSYAIAHRHEEWYG
ncbi:MAG TPA: hypothetical protein PKM21_07435 [Anaerolineales bacterium]|nr:hypothetical protein [Anaerolineales bacterium]